MKKTNFLNIYSLLAFLILGLSACEEADDVVAENITMGLGSYPVSSNTFTDLTNGGTIPATRIYPAGSTLSFELQYWSDAPIKEINYYQTVGTSSRELILNKPYAASFSRIKSADTLVLSYMVPAVAVGITIKLEAEIKNENTLSVIRSISFKTK